MKEEWYFTSFSSTLFLEFYIGLPSTTEETSSPHSTLTSTGHTSPTPSTSPTPADYTGAITGGVIGGVLLITVLVIVIVFCVKARAKPAEPQILNMDVNGYDNQSNYSGESRDKIFKNGGLKV